MEIEIKIKISQLDALKKKVVNYQFQILEPRFHEYNLVFDTHDRILKGRGHLLRLRKQGGKAIVTFKSPPEIPSQTYKVREETEVSVSDFENMKKIIHKLGFEPVFIYEKYREIFIKNDIKLMIDETPIGNYLEIEGEGPEIDRTASLLGYSKKDYIIESYRSLYLKHKNKAERQNHMIFETGGKR